MTNCRRSKSTSFIRSLNNSINRNPLPYINSAINRVVPSIAPSNR